MSSSTERPQCAASEQYRKRRARVRAKGVEKLWARVDSERRAGVCRAEDISDHPRGESTP
jgi:hypothetical protein